MTEIHWSLLKALSVAASDPVLPSMALLAGYSEGLVGMIELLTAGLVSWSSVRLAAGGAGAGTDGGEPEMTVVRTTGVVVDSTVTPRVDDSCDNDTDSRLC